MVMSNFFHIMKGNKVFRILTRLSFFPHNEGFDAFSSHGIFHNMTTSSIFHEMKSLFFPQNEKIRKQDDFPQFVGAPSTSDRGGH